MPTTRTEMLKKLLAIAESAYGKLADLGASETDLRPLRTEMNLLSAEIRACQGIPGGLPAIPGQLSIYDLLGSGPRVDR